jgi:hypothetical protein
MQPAIELLAPEIEKPQEDREPGRNVQILPDVALEDVGMIRQAVEDLGRRQAIRARLPNLSHIASSSPPSIAVVVGLGRASYCLRA